MSSLIDKIHIMQMVRSFADEWEKESGEHREDPVDIEKVFMPLHT